MTAISSRAESAVEMESDVNWVDDTTARVQSESDPEKEYVVDIEQMACSCPDHRYRGTSCKHLYKAADDSDLISLSQ